jgi:hypothetical protein
MTCVSRAKVNLDAMNALTMCERCFEHGGNYVFYFSKPFI